MATRVQARLNEILANITPPYAIHDMALPEDIITIRCGSCKEVWFLLLRQTQRSTQDR